MAGASKSEKRTLYYLIGSIAAACFISLALLTGRIIFTGSLRYIFLVWNLVLAVTPLLLAWWLYDRLKTESWFKWPQILLTAAYIGFLPNTFYLITDFVHLEQFNEASLYFDVILLSGFVFNGTVLGFVSIYLLHRQLLRRVSERTSLYAIGIIFLLASFAAYLGRFTRFNTWDIVLRPAGLLFDVSDRFVNPTQHADTYISTVSLFFVLFSSYMVAYFSIKFVSGNKT
ncbi:MAG TPA: DUF1361 domain-containing protein [Candidatus Saccharimonadales bacterium]|nr:DUF1361 domain-containing protein [Candidatus Saccharimonadales bacterium]